MGSVNCDWPTSLSWLRASQSAGDRAPAQPLKATPVALRMQPKARFDGGGGDRPVEPGSDCSRDVADTHPSGFGQHGDNRTQNRAGRRRWNVGRVGFDGRSPEVAWASDVLMDTLEPGLEIGFQRLPTRPVGWP